MPDLLLIKTWSEEWTQIRSHKQLPNTWPLSGTLTRPASAQRRAAAARPHGVGDVYTGHGAGLKAGRLARGAWRRGKGWIKFAQWLLPHPLSRPINSPRTGRGKLVEWGCGERLRDFFTAKASSSATGLVGACSPQEPALLITGVWSIIVIAIMPHLSKCGCQWKRGNEDN